MYADVLSFPPRPEPVRRDASPEPIRWIRASAGNTVRLFPVSEIICLEARQR